VIAVRGNVDHGAWAADLPERRELDVAGYRIVLTHQLSADERVASNSGANVVIFGHSHRPEAVRHDGVLFLNPGSAGPRRFRLPVAVARLELGPVEARARLIDLDV
jgi:putative phosphoesterase